jgi:hypothetical protein
MIMSRQRAKLATVILLFAGCAFIADVLSPATPTPKAQGSAHSFLLELNWLVSTTAADVPPSRSGIDALYSILSPVTLQPRVVSALICVLLC